MSLKRRAVASSGGRLTGRGNTADVELVLAKPNLVVDYGSVTATFASLADRVQSQTDPDFEFAVRSDPLWQAVSAGRNGRVRLAPAVAFGWIDFLPSLNRLIGLRRLACVLYPDAFSEDLRPAVREFYPDEAQLEMLLASTRARS